MPHFSHALLFLSAFKISAVVFVAQIRRDSQDINWNFNSFSWKSAVRIRVFFLFLYDFHLSFEHVTLDVIIRTTANKSRVKVRWSLLRLRSFEIWTERSCVSLNKKGLYINLLSSTVCVGIFILNKLSQREQSGTTE